MRLTHKAEDVNAVADLDIELTRSLWDSKPRKQLEADAVRQTKNAENAGFVVWDIKNRFDHGDRTASKGQAFRTRVAFLKQVDAMRIFSDRCAILAEKINNLFIERLDRRDFCLRYNKCGGAYISFDDYDDCDIIILNNSEMRRGYTLQQQTSYLVQELRNKPFFAVD